MIIFRVGDGESVSVACSVSAVLWADYGCIKKNAK